MNHAEELKSDAVVFTEINRKSGSPAATRKADGSVVPFGIDDLRRRHVQMGNFSGREDRKHATLLQPGKSFANSTPITFDRAVGLERIDKNAVLREFGDVAEKEVRENLDVGPDTGQQNGEDRAVQYAVGMIGDYNYRTGCGNASLIRGINPQADAHGREQIFKFESVGSLLHPAIEVANFVYGGKFRGKSREACDTR